MGQLLLIVVELCSYQNDDVRNIHKFEYLIRFFRHWLMPKMVITRYSLPQNNDNLPLTFFGDNLTIVLMDNIYQWLHRYTYGFTWINFFMIVYVIRKIGGNRNSPNSFNVMVNYHYHGANMVKTG